MMKKYLSFALICLLLITADASLISAQTDKDAALAAKIKTTVAERGTGEKKRVEVKKKDGTKLKGYISQADEDSFTLIDSTTKQSTEIDYGDVAKVKNRSSKGDKIALGIIIGAAAVAGIILGSLLITRCRNEGGC
jgi:small nuclear ribonucleoprotein (snRNP)-like protein